MTSISTSALSAAPRLSVIQAQNALSKAQVELSSGKLADIGLGLGSATGTYVSLGVQSGRLQAVKSSNATTAATLTAVTTSLDAMRATASQFLDQLTGTGSSASTSDILADVAGSNLAALTASLNTSVGGNAIFGGLNTAEPPLTTYTATSPAKAAVDGSFASSFPGSTPGSASAASISGDAMQSYLDGAFASLFSESNFEGTWSSATPGSPLPVTTAQISPTETIPTSVNANAQPFRQLAQAYAMVKEFGHANLSSDAGQAVIASATKLVSAAMAGLTDAEAGIGLSQSAVSAADDRMSAQIDYLSTRAANLVGVDPAGLATEISGLQTQIQASYEITSQLQQLSLVNFLK